MITERLELIPASVALCDAEREGRQALERALRVRVPASWPPPVFEADDIERIRRQLEREPPSAAWTLHYLVLREHVPGQARDLLGIAGYVAPPSSDGAVEIGYAVAEEHQRRGYATEAVEALVRNAFRDPGLVRLIATTYPTLPASIQVLRKAGFAQTEHHPETGLLTYELRRPALAATPIRP